MPERSFVFIYREVGQVNKWLLKCGRFLKLNLEMFGVGLNVVVLGNFGTDFGRTGIRT